jgi:transcriptional regulator with XRE-family HTH domain
MDSKQIGARIKALREQRGWTLREMNRRVGLSPSYFSRLEDGYTDPRLADLKLIADAFGVPLSTVVGEVETSVEMTKRINAHPTLAGRVGALLDVYEGADETRRTLIETIMDSVAQLAPQSHYNANNDKYFYSRQLVSA